MMIIQLMRQGSLRYTLSNNFNNSLWSDKINWLRLIAVDLRNLNKLGYCRTPNNTDIGNKKIAY